jgi:hypothetical protein
MSALNGSTPLVSVLTRQMSAVPGRSFGKKRIYHRGHEEQEG